MASQDSKINEILKKYLGNSAKIVPQQNKTESNGNSQTQLAGTPSTTANSGSISSSAQQTNTPASRAGPFSSTLAADQNSSNSSGSQKILRPRSSASVVSQYALYKQYAATKENETIKDTDSKIKKGILTADATDPKNTAEIPGTQISISENNKIKINERRTNNDIAVEQAFPLPSTIALDQMAKNKKAEINQKIESEIIQLASKKALERVAATESASSKASKEKHSSASPHIVSATTANNNSISIIMDNIVALRKGMDNLTQQNDLLREQLSKKDNEVLNLKAALNDLQLELQKKTWGMDIKLNKILKLLEDD